MNACSTLPRWLLRKYTWSFAIKRDSIAADGDGPTWGDWDRYTKPNDFLRLLRDDESGQAVDWKIEGQLHPQQDGAPLEIRYIADIDDPNLYDALFVEAFACKLARALLRGSHRQHAEEGSMQADFDDAIAEAKRTARSRRTRGVPRRRVDHGEALNGPRVHDPERLQRRRTVGAPARPAGRRQVRLGPLRLPERHPARAGRLDAPPGHGVPAPDEVPQQAVAAAPVPVFSSRRPTCWSSATSTSASSRSTAS
jgi:hypothetical protein